MSAPIKDQPYFSSRSRNLNLEEAFQDLSIFLGLSIFVVTAALVYAQAREAGIDLHAPQHLFLMMLAGLTLTNLGVFSLIRRYHKKWQTIEKEGGLDQITGAMNRIHFEKLLSEELRRGGRYHYPITLCILDLDGFGDHNERLGRKEGDRLLKRFSDLLRGSVRFADCVARYHGDEFCVLLPHTDIVRAEKFMSRLTAAASEHTETSFCAGVASYQAGESRAQFIMRALSALTQAKQEGPRRIRYSVSVPAAGVLEA